MRISTTAKVQTTMSTAENRLDSEDAYNFAEYLSEQISQNASIEKVTVHTQILEDLEFELSIKSNDCIDENDFTCNILAESKVKTEMTSEEVWQELLDDTEAASQLAGYIKDFVDNLNIKISHIMHPVRETFIFSDEHFYIKMDPYSSYTPDFTNFIIDSDTIDINEIAENFYTE